MQNPIKYPNNPLRFTLSYIIESSVEHGPCSDLNTMQQPTGRNSANTTAAVFGLFTGLVTVPSNDMLPSNSPEVVHSRK